MILLQLQPADIVHGSMAEGTLQGGKADLLTCGSVCRLWRALALPYIFRDLQVSFRSLSEEYDRAARKNSWIDGDEQVPERSAQFQFWEREPCATCYRWQSLSRFRRFLCDPDALSEGSVLKNIWGTNRLFSACATTIPTAASES